MQSRRVQERWEREWLGEQGRQQGQGSGKHERKRWGARMVSQADTGSGWKDAPADDMLTGLILQEIVQP